jgi:hypothetical protein
VDQPVVQSERPDRVADALDAARQAWTELGDAGRLRRDLLRLLADLEDGR